MSKYRRIGPWVFLAVLLCAPAYAMTLLGVFSGAALHVDTQIETPATNNNAKTLPVPKAGDTIRFQLFAPAGGGNTTNGYTVELDVPGKTLANHVGTVSGVDWNGNALIVRGAATLSALFISGATVPSSGYLGQVSVSVTRELDAGARLVVKRMEMTSGRDVDQLGVGAAEITFTAGGNAGDFNNDGSVDLSDFLAFANMFGTSPGEAGYDARGDFDNDGSINLSDFLAFANTFGATYPVGGGGGGGDLTAGTIRRLTHNDASDNAPAWSPDGRHIAFNSYRDDNWEVYVMDADGSNPRKLTHNAATDLGPAWSPDGRHIAFHSYRDGNKAEIYVMDADGSNPRNLTHNAATDGYPAWSPDGRHIAFHSYRDGNKAEIYVMDADGSNPRNLTHNAASDFGPSWSPDGRHIAFDSYRDGNNAEIYVMDADGSNPRRLTHNDAADFGPSWSPDGRHIAFQSFRDGNKAEIYVMDADGSNPRNLTHNAATDGNPAWSPDGRQIAFRSDGDGNLEIYVMELRMGAGGGSRPDLVVNSPSVSDRMLTTGESFTLRATVRNRGSDASGSATLRFYRSSNASITTADTIIASVNVPGLAASGEREESVSLRAPSASGTYYFGACVISVGAESDTRNNCSDGVRVTVTASGGGSGNNLGACAVGMVVKPNQGCSVGRAEFINIGGGCYQYTAFGTGRFCSSGFNLNGLQGTRSGSDFRITAVP